MKIAKIEQKSQVTFKTRESAAKITTSKWWEAKSQREMADGIVGTVTYLKESQGHRLRAAGLYAKLYGNMPLFDFIGNNLSKLDQSSSLPVDRPTFNVVQSCIDTLLSKVTHSRPSPVFLTDNSDYRQRNLAKKLNNFISGELYQTDAHDKVGAMFRDAMTLGTGCLKVLETPDKKVGLERILNIELFVDPSESIYGNPRQLYQVKLMDRNVLKDSFKSDKSMIDKAEGAYPDNSAESAKAISDLVLVVEGWHLRSGPNAKDGKHVIACSSGVLLEEDYDKEGFPFIFLHYSPRLLGFWAQGLSEQLMGTQLEINSLLYTISRAIKLVGVPRVFVEEGSKVNKASFNNDIGTIVPYRGTKPVYEVAPCVPAELYEQLQRLIQYAYQQSGVSALDASAQKPAGLNSGEAIRTYDDISTDRMAVVARRYDNAFIDLAYMIIDKAKDIAERDGKYRTVYPGKDGTKAIDLPHADLLQDPFVIQCFNMSALPRDPAGRLEKVTEMTQAGMITLKEGRRLLDFPDLSQIEKLANASEERIFQILDAIVEDGTYSPPDPFIDLALASELTTSYINLYGTVKLEEEKMHLLRNFFTQVQALIRASQPPAQPQPQAQPAPQANPQPQPQSPLVSNAKTA